MRRGFSLLELLIALLILGLLTVSSVMGFSRQQRRSRDSRRISDISTIALALESYAAIHSSYPATPVNTWKPASNSTDVLGVLVNEGLINTLPSDPKLSGSATGTVPARNGKASPYVCGGYYYQAPSDYFEPGSDRVWTLAFGSEQAGVSNKHPADSTVEVLTFNTGCSPTRYLALLNGHR